MEEIDEKYENNNNNNIKKSNDDDDCNDNIRIIQ